MISLRTLAAKSGVPGAGREAFRFKLQFAGHGYRSTCTIATRWHGVPGGVAPDEPLDPEVQWITFPIVESGPDYVVWAFDAGDEGRVGQGWKIAARVPTTSVASAQASFAQSGFPVTCIR